ncbi:pectinesterase family protein [Actinopolymorpha alba]|uniref:pectinesterase family protein n=1 Tax=Actinopolymorpha alba TaxID=533267 RepID=UPI0003627DAD|nr:pectinesterase family protein [Actinopolymorpha alba]
MNVDPWLEPQTGATGVCVDTPLRLAFGDIPRIGARGLIEVHSADGSLVDRIDLADPRAYRRTVGGARSDAGVPHEFHYFPVIVNGTTATIYLHQQLAYDTNYQITIDPEVFDGFPGLRRGTWCFTTRSSPPPTDARRLLVAADGAGDFSTLQGALDFVPEGNSEEFLIDVAPGIYTEINYVGPEKPFITVRGHDRTRTVIQYANNNVLNGQPSESRCPRRRLDKPDLYNCWRANFGVEASDFTLENLTLRNTTPDGGSQAEAFRANADRVLLNRVTLISRQDTVRLQGSCLVTNSSIEGDVDFIWGVGGVFVQESNLTALGAGYYTQIRNDDTLPGNVFVRNRLTRADDVPDESVYLGRIATEVFPHSQVIFIDTIMDRHIHRHGWHITPDDCTRAQQVRFWEYHSVDLDGMPVDVRHRLACARQLTSSEAAYWSDPAVVLGGWVPVTVNASPQHDRDESAIRVNWTAPPGHSSQDWIRLYQAGIPGAECLARQLVGSEHTTGATTFQLPDVAGDYEFRYVPDHATPAPWGGATSNVVRTRDQERTRAWAEFDGHCGR